MVPRLLSSGLAVALCAIGVQGDGTGLIGWGTTLYDPTCSFACRNVLRAHILDCTPVDTGENHGTAHNPVVTPPDCFVEDHVFLHTMALCIDTYCPLSDDPSLSKLEDYWASHLGTGTIGDYTYVPIMSYQDALAAARKEESRAAENNTSTSGGEEDEGKDENDHGNHSARRRSTSLLAARHGDMDSDVPEGLDIFDVSSDLPYTSGGMDPLNETSFVDPVAWQLQWNYMHDFEVNEAGHSTATITVTIVAIFLPLAVSLLRFVPGLTRSNAWVYVQALFVMPTTFGKRHRQPVAGVGNVPTRGQALYIGVISLVNIVCWLAPYTIHQPQASFDSLKLQSISIIGNRAGTMAMGNAVALFLFAARNNFLLYLTDWSYSTYLLLHRWLGYWAIFHTVVHSFMLLAVYVLRGSYEDELIREYWIWGIVGTVAACAILLFSFQWVRQRFYEAFLATHIVMSLLFLIGYYYHIWYLYEYNWGYEYWMFIAGAIWGADRLFRLVRSAWRGLRVATVTAVDGADGEYLRIEVEGKQFNDGVVYLGFPTLNWRVWETHPFSVAYSGVGSMRGNSGNSGESEVAQQPMEGPMVVGEEPTAAGADPEKAVKTSQTLMPDASAETVTVLYARVRDGFTKELAARVGEAKSASPVRLRVLLEGPYHHSGHVSPQLKQCGDMVCIAGGVGITACLPYVRKSLVAGSTKLFWSSRHQGLVTAFDPAINSLPASVSVDRSVGERFDLGRILLEEAHMGSSPLAVVVCGPPGMADEVRRRLVEITRTTPKARPFVLIDEAFAW